jgi:hypothetical protein
MALPALTSTDKSTSQATHLPTHSLNWSILLDRDNKESILTPIKKPQPPIVEKMNSQTEGVYPSGLVTNQNLMSGH